MDKNKELKTTNKNELKTIEPEKKALSPSERFTAEVQRQFAYSGGEVNLTSFQKKLCQNYFLKLDLSLKEAEKRRLAKSEKYRDPLPLTWDNININILASDVIIYSGLGLDPMQPNHISLIPAKSNNKYQIAFILGYRGAELKAKKYGLDIPDDIVIELVYSTDTFKQFKKDMNNKVEDYEFKVNNDFNRGDLVGGFYYKKYYNNPEKNHLHVFSKKDIEKRKPDYAPPEFWGGEKDVWQWDEKKGKSVKTGTQHVEGWLDEMAYKTIYKAAYNSITIDSEKIDQNYMLVIQRENDARDLKLLEDIKNNANKDEIGIEDEPPAQNAEIIDDEQPVAEDLNESENEIEEELNPDYDHRSGQQQFSFEQGQRAPFM